MASSVSSTDVPYAPPSASAAPAPVLSPTVKLGSFVRELEVPVVSLALGETRAAALGDEVWLHEKGAWKKTAIPEKLRFRNGDGEGGRIFFGRDDRPRIMGARLRDGKPSQLYLRYRNDRWQAERNEIAKLRNPPPQAMWGLLGHLDPEVVCKVDDECIIKRRSGWKMMPSGSASPRVELHNGVAWLLRNGAVERLIDDRRWEVVGAPAPFQEPGGVWALGEDVWVSEPATGKLHHWQGGRWTSEVSPVEGPRGFWGAAGADVWLAGATGLAHFDGKSWARVEGPTGPLAEVYGRGSEIWAAGKGGVWVRRSP